MREKARWDVEKTWVEEESGESEASAERSVRRALRFDSDGGADSPFLANRPFTLDSSQEETIVIWAVFGNKQPNRKQKGDLRRRVFTGKEPNRESIHAILHPTTWDCRRESGRKAAGRTPLNPIP